MCACVIESVADGEISDNEDEDVDATLDLVRKVSEMSISGLGMASGYKLCVFATTCALPMGHRKY